MSIRLERLTKWIEENPYRVYADYRDTISDEQAAMLLAGDFDEFNESIWQWEINASDSIYEYNGWQEWESEFATTAGYDAWDDMPEWLHDFATESRHVDCSDLIESAIRNYDGMIVATLYKRNGEPIEFQGAWDSSTARYLKRYCGIDPHKSEPTYAGTYMKALGTIDLLAIYKSGIVPSRVLVSSDIMTIGHEALNGPGTLGDDQYKGAPRWYKASFRVDALDRYGVNAVFGLTGCWRTELTEMKIGTKNHVTVGARVQIPAYTDLWMQGARVGTVERFIAGSGDYLAANDSRAADIFVVRLDHPQVKRLHRFIADDCRCI